MLGEDRILSSREDSRAFGAQLEKLLVDAWNDICARLAWEPLPRPGRRTIYDVAAMHPAIGLLGVDVKTTDLDDDRYSDGGVCSVDNIIRFLANDQGIMLVLEVAHRLHREGRRIERVTVAPFHALPHAAYRIENLGTGQIRLNTGIGEIEVEWTRSADAFLNHLVGIAIDHYRRVQEDAQARIRNLEAFRESGFRGFRAARRPKG